MRLLFIGDVVGRPGREALSTAMPDLRAERLPDLVVVNGENSAGGVGVTKETAEQLFAAGADVITLGNHTYRHREVYPYLDSERRILRPVNFREANPGHGHTVVEAAGMRVAVINLSGQMHLQVERNPFTAPSTSCSIKAEPNLLVGRLMRAQAALGNLDFDAAERELAVLVKESS